MLDKELDKLRDKTLSFWCVIIKSDWTIYRSSGAWWTMPVSNKIIWHPLTRWRIVYLRSKINQCKDWFSLEMFFHGNKEFYNQSELERMKSPHREELKKLLIQFSNYL